MSLAGSLRLLAWEYTKIFHNSCKFTDHFWREFDLPGAMLSVITVNLQLLWKILVYSHASNLSDPASDIFGPELAKDKASRGNAVPELLQLSDLGPISELVPEERPDEN
jgi:hypothetical protein